MEIEIKLYEDEFFYITNCKEYPKVPGLIVIYSKLEFWYHTEKSIKKLAFIEKEIREELLNQGFELAGIYREEYQENKFKIYIIPYKVSILEQNNISPDMYQPYILKYLETFQNSCEYSNDINIKILKRLKKMGEVNEQL